MPSHDETHFPPLADAELDRLSLLSHLVISDLNGAYKRWADDERWNLTGGPVVVSAGGLATIEFPMVPPGQDWKIERVTFVTDAATTGTGTARVDSAIDPTAVVMATNAPTLAVVEALNPIYLRSYQRLYVVLTGGTPAVNFFTRIQYALREGEPVKEN